MNSFIHTQDGLSLVVQGKPYTINRQHPNWETVINLVKSKRFDQIPAAIEMLTVVKKALTTTSSKMSIDAKSRSITFNGYPIHHVLTDQILKMMEDKFDLLPMEKFLANLYDNPSNRAVNELYQWMVANQLTITEDGNFIAYKRVNQQYKSFYDGTTDHSMGSTPQMPRNQVDDRSNVTCSRGLHFCSYNYLPEYMSGAGRVLVLEINPADVVSIPTDYKHAKGRACKYKVVGELTGDQFVNVERTNVISQPVVTTNTNLNISNAERSAYHRGYKDGRNHLARVYYENDPQSVYTAYNNGYKDGRNKKPRLYGKEVALAAVHLLAPFQKMLTIFGQHVQSVDAPMVVLNYPYHIAAVEQTFNIECQDADLAKCFTFGQFVRVVDTLINKGK